MSGLMLATAAIMFITGCTDESVTNNDATISYINTLDEQATFYVKKSTDSDSIYHNKHKIVSLMPGEYSDEIKHKWAACICCE